MISGCFSSKRVRSAAERSKTWPVPMSVIIVVCGKCVGISLRYALKTPQYSSIVDIIIDNIK